MGEEVNAELEIEGLNKAKKQMEEKKEKEHMGM